MKTRDDHIEFLRLNGTRVSSCAWNGFQNKGRGLVCVMAGLENEIQRTVPFDFMPVTDAPKVFKPWIGSKESRMAEAYDPETEIVIAFLREGEDGGALIDSYKVQTRPSPPAAAEME